MHLLYSYYRILTFFVCFLSWTLTASSQAEDHSMTYNRSATPNGSTSFLNSAADISPSLYTGGLQLSLPIYTLKSSDLQVPIALVYTAANGVRPTDPNTVVGMNWMLMAGGSISRTVRGLPDESDYGYIGTHQEGMNVVNDFNSPSALGTQNFNNRYHVGQAPVDGEPDLFVISTPYFSVQFTLDQNGKPVFVGGNSGLQIVQQLYNNSLFADNTGITVIDPQGTQYIFGSQSTTREMTTTSFFGTPIPYVSTWYLEKIVTLNAKDVVNFTYQTQDNETVYTYEANKLYTSTFASSGFPNNDPTSYSSPNALPVSVNTIVYNLPKFVKTITTKSGEADFAYTPNSVMLINASNPPALTGITIKQFNPITRENTNILQTYAFSYSDVLNTVIPGTPFDAVSYWAYYRRMLNTITVAGNTAATSSPLLLYQLKYFQGQQLANRASPQFCDFWGYQNNTDQFYTDASNADLNYFTVPDATRQPASFIPTGATQLAPMAANFALQELDQLGGARTVFNFQQNDYYNGSANVAAGGMRVSSIVRTLPTGESLTTSYSYYDFNGHSTGQIWSDLYRHVRLYLSANCCNVPTDAVSTSPYGISDDAGVMLGYSSVKVTDPNGGSSVSNFSNFSDFPDIIPAQSFFGFLNSSSTYQFLVSEQLSSFSYKRGLLLSRTAFKANGDMVSQDINAYGSVDPGSPPPAVKAIGIQDMTWYTTEPEYAGVNIYHSNIEDWRLQQSIHRDYDQKIPGRFLQSTTNYTYAADNRQLRSISTTDSKGQNHSVTCYYANDINIPFVTSTEQSTLATLASPAVNATNLLIHRVDSRNGVIHQWHYTYAPFQIGLATNYYLTTTTAYTGNTAELQQFSNYDVTTSQSLSSNMTAGKYTSTSYGYNSTYPVVKIENAVNTASLINQIASQSQTLSFSTNTPTQVIHLTTQVPGSFTISLPAGTYLGTGSVPPGGGPPRVVTVFFSFQLTSNSGSFIQSGSLCNSNTFGACSISNTATVPNVPAGDFTLTVSTGSSWESGGVASVPYTFQGLTTVPSGYTEFFFEGFEEQLNEQQGTGHTGTMYSSGDYPVTFVPPTNKPYLIQWWSLSGGQWLFHQQAYTTNMLLSGPVDDVRVFPSDALMTTYTYSPLVGKTSETDPSGKTITYEYDGLGRLLRIRDQDGNILKQYDYGYQVSLQQ